MSWSVKSSEVQIYLPNWTRPWVCTEVKNMYDRSKCMNLGESEQVERQMSIIKEKDQQIIALKQGRKRLESEYLLCHVRISRILQMKEMTSF
jgi:hypothetical protein